MIENVNLLQAMLGDIWMYVYGTILVFVVQVCNFFKFITINKLLLICSNYHVNCWFKYYRSINYCKEIIVQNIQIKVLTYSLLLFEVEMLLPCFRWYCMANKITSYFLALIRASSLGKEDVFEVEKAILFPVII